MKISKRKKRKEDDEQPMMNCNIPNEMVIEILGRVACQDLVQNLKLVCKKWYSIIYNGSFAYSHFEHNNNNNKKKKSSSFSQLKALVISTSNGKSVTVSSLEWHDNFLEKPFENLTMNDCKDLFTVEYTSESRIEQMSFHKANCVNGFVCFWSTRHARFHICNSMTMEYVTTPPNPYWSSIRGNHITAGLGFCPITYQYKLVVFQSHYDFDAPKSSELVKGSISTINGKDQSWRPLKWIDDSLEPGPRSPACVNGALYWTTNTTCADYSRGIYDTTILVAFDIAKEESYVIEVPIESEAHHVSIEEKGGKICLITNELCHDSRCILFKGYIAHNMNDLENLNSWKLEFNVTIYDIYGQFGDQHMSFTNEILMVDTYESMSFFDVATGKILDEFQTSNSTRSILIPYVPSLISLHHRPVREKKYLDAVCGL
ncbi:putative F-box protein At1g32420 [Solanum lycopersicum]|uniref:putative F-box protein At1g32420 n=1 Tax=Solanum lycopersicum TaxID=4081 RepID=UPI0037480424